MTPRVDYPSLFRFCPHCGNELAEFVSEDGFVRRQCKRCDWTQYRNPTVGVAVILMDEMQRLLLGSRRDGGWCIPCGHVEWDESIEDAARRESLEETGLHVELDELFSVQSNLHRPERQTVGVWYRGVVVAGELRPGGDLVEVGFFELAKLPELKFPTDRTVVERIRAMKPHEL